MENFDLIVDVSTTEKQIAERFYKDYGKER